MEVPTAAKRSNQSGASRRVTQNKSPTNGEQTGQFMKSPVFRPVYKFQRSFELDGNVVCDGINPVLVGTSYLLSQLPSYTDFTKLFDMYRITKIEVQFYPEYTELTDAAPVSNAVNVLFNSAVDISDNSAPLSVNALLEYQQVKATGITKVHTTSWIPTMKMGGVVPCMCWLPTANPSEPHYGLKIAIPPTGVSMTFRCKVKYWLECANVN